MKSKAQFIFLYLLTLMGCEKGPMGKLEDPRVILISIDGLRGDLLTDSIFKNNCPNMYNLMSIGTFCANVQSVFPSLTYPAHTSMISGVMPKEHGIFHNKPFVPNNNFAEWYWYQDKVKTPTLITEIKKRGLVSLGISWPVTVGAPINYMLPEIQSVNDSISTVDLIKKHDNPKRFLESAKIRGVIPDNGNPQGYTRDLLLHELFLDAFKEKTPHLSLYHMIETDLAQHKYGKNSREAINAFMFMDSLIGNIIALLAENNLWSSTTLIITGDHGFRNYSKQLSINKLFEEKGWINIEKGEIKDWRVIGLSSGGSAFIRIKNDENNDFKKKVRVTLSRQEEFETLERRHMNSFLWAPIETDFLLLAKENYCFIQSLDQSYITEKSGGTHGGDPRNSQLKTGYIAAGRGIEKGVLKNMMITDIAFQISALLDLNLSQRN